MIRNVIRDELVGRSQGGSQESVVSSIKSLISDYEAQISKKYNELVPIFIQQYKLLFCIKFKNNMRLMVIHTNFISTQIQVVIK